MTTPAERIVLAAMATATIDDALWPAIARLQRVGQVGNGAGIYADISAFRRELRIVRAIIDTAETLIADTDWPSNKDYDAS